LPQEATPFITFHIEHVIAKQHVDDKRDESECLSLACDRCNAFKGTNLSTIDPKTRKQVKVFDPRNDLWQDHFQFNGPIIEGHTAIGRGTVRLLHMNDKRRIELRQEWLKEGRTL
jgi:hypothetical protein